MNDYPDEPGPESPSDTHATPRWVKVFGAVGIGVILLFIVLQFATGGKHGPGRHMGPVDDGKAPSGAHKGAGVVGEPADAEDATRTIEVTTLDTMAFVPSRISVSAGETIGFVVTNAGKSVHEFTLGSGVHSGSNSITMQPGETKQIIWSFSETGTLEYACHEPGHYEAGMRGQITIRPIRSG